MTENDDSIAPLSERRRPRLALAVGLALAFGTLIFDLSRPLGVASAVPYVAVVLAGLVSQKRSLVVAFGVLTTVLTLVGFFAVPIGSGATVTPRVEFLNRGLTIFAIWAVTATAVGYLGSQKRWEERLSNLAIEDPLTGLANRRYILEQLGRQMKLVDRYEQTFSVALFDIDRFKEFNDRYGHQVGDEVLRMVARLGEGCIRDSDEIARFGGEEFLVVCPSTTLEQAVKVGERVRREIENFELWRDGLRLSVTVSVGVAQCPEQPVPIEQVLHNADEALYKAKKDGRNKVVAFDPLVVSGTLEIPEGGEAAG